MTDTIVRVEIIHTELNKRLMFQQFDDELKASTWAEDMVAESKGSCHHITHVYRLTDPV